MAGRRGAGRPVGSGAYLLLGVTVGTVVVLAVMLSVPPPLKFSLGFPRSGTLKELGCSAGECENVTVGFHGLASLDPAQLRVSIVGANGSTIVNGSAGHPMNLVYLPGSTPHWESDFGGSTYATSPFAAEFVDPNGTVVGPTGAPMVLPGATFCLKGTYPSTEEFRLTFSYQGTSASVLVALA